MSIFKFEDKLVNDSIYTLDADDSPDTPGALQITCEESDTLAIFESVSVDLPREQVEKLVARLTEWLHPPRARK